MIYSAEVIDTIDNGPNRWKYLKVGVFRHEGETKEQIGEYIRNYPSLFNAFFPFQHNGKELALYSPDYTATRIMELPSRKDLGGEERDTAGFCPVEFYVPSYIIQERSRSTGHLRCYRVDDPSEDALIEKRYEHTYINQNTKEQITEQIHERPVIPLTYYPFGFVSGCIWGEDMSWKVQYLDLEESDKGILKREERFGYIALPDNLTLKQAIDMSEYQYDPEDELSNTITIAVQTRFDLRTGKRWTGTDEDDE